MDIEYFTFNFLSIVTFNPTFAKNGKKTLYAALFHFKCQKDFVAPIVFFTVGNVSKWLFEW